VAEWQTRLPGLTQSELRKNPDVNYLLPLYDGMGIFVTAGVQQAGKGDQVKVASFNATPAALDLVKKGPTFTADPGQNPGWLADGGVDQAMRGMLKMEPADPKVPLRFFDKSNLQGVDSNDQNALFGTSYKDGFRQLWGLSG
jgi:ribose transport system substrate-binding protein